MRRCGMGKREDFLEMCTLIEIAFRAQFLLRADSYLFAFPSFASLTDKFLEVFDAWEQDTSRTEMARLYHPHLPNKVYAFDTMPFTISVLLSERIASCTIFFQDLPEGKGSLIEGFAEQVFEILKAREEKTLSSKFILFEEDGKLASFEKSSCDIEAGYWEHSDTAFCICSKWKNSI